MTPPPVEFSALVDVMHHGWHDGISAVVFHLQGKDAADQRHERHRILPGLFDQPRLPARIRERPEDDILQRGGDLVARAWRAPAWFLPLAIF